MKKLLIYNADICGQGTGWVLTEGERIAATGHGEGRPAEIVADCHLEEYDAEGALLLPGAIDCHVHFREPGLTHKATIHSESRAALTGGVTSYLEMPNTTPQTTSIATWQDKMNRAEKDSAANYGFFIGATHSNIDELKKIDTTHVPGVKLFLGSSTGNMLVDNDDALHRLFGEIKLPISVHAEDERTIAECKARIISEYGETPPVFTHTMIRPVEACVKATARAIELARQHNAKLHVAHLTTANEVEMVKQAGDNVTCEVSPHHLTFSSDDYATLGARIKMNPAVKSAHHREALRNALKNGDIDIVATDHAPHLLSEKEGGALKAVSGAPMVQFSLPAVLELVDARTAARVMSERPAEIFSIVDRGRIAPGYFADMVIVKREPQTITDDSVYEECAAHWTPLAGRTLSHRVDRVYLNGALAVSNEKLRTPLPKAHPLEFRH